jgi:WD40 repeat protein
MKNAITYYVAFGFMFTLFSNSLSAQKNEISNSNNPNVYEADKRVDNYMELQKLGYAEKEIFEDLGNANFLAENYETALFWYDKLKNLTKNEVLNGRYQERYSYALKKTSSSKTIASSDKDWLALIKKDYEIHERSMNLSTNELAGNYKSLDPYLNGDENLDSQPVAYDDKQLENLEKFSSENSYETPIALTADGKTAFFSQTVYVKPLNGIFSKKEPIHKIYRANKINGQWEDIKELKVCPKYSSALHPTVSADGKRLFFASDMPGTLGKYDIYVSAIQNNGTLGIAKNLGEKVNTKKNDLYPNIVGGNTLFFASEGREGHGGLDVYMVQVDHRKVGLAVNLGSPINSAEDDFSVRFKTKDRMGYVMSNRGKNKSNIHQVAFSYENKRINRSVDKREYEILEFLNSDLKVDYSSSVFEDE